MSSNTSKIKPVYVNLFRFSTVFLAVVIGFSCTSEVTMQEVNEQNIVENMGTVEHQSDDPSKKQQTTIDILQNDMFRPPYEIDNMADVKSAMLNGSHFDLEVAVTPKERSKGFMGRQMVNESQAMLFVYRKNVEPVFWMKNTAIPLDLMFIDSTGKIESIHTMEPQIGVEDRDLETFSPDEPIKYAIEIKGGLAQEIGVTIGSIILFK